MRPWLYTHLYRKGAPWDRYGVGQEVIDLVDSGRVDAQSHPRVLDLGCGTGATTVYLAQQGFDVVGVDFTPIALERARQRAEEAGVTANCKFVHGDLTEAEIPELAEPFDVLIDYSTIDDHRRPQRKAIARTVHRLSRPGSVYFLWCFSAYKKDLPLVARGRMSRLLHTVMSPGEERELFGDSFDIEQLPSPERPAHAKCFVLTRR